MKIAYMTVCEYLPFLPRQTKFWFSDPYDLYFCNFNEGVLKDYLKRHIPTIEEPAFPLNVHKESYLDLFPKDKIVYLTPHSKDTMEVYDHDAIYVIGAIVDKVIFITIFLPLIIGMSVLD